ncbi:bifunctional [glutamate--ammonia ligase]-adenylyl-L-tyrosine phosphorylase/[glutamate--ammonia-ligase] adenylyltransferase [Neptunicella marina]|uniref:bifunctional [glutamate--ammonia ligase]-adenylyl-L-tyrosine phosphorylase/[glutamate--ammonia-ligase] adenylyltransferase n=1 Tax=Neptunicella marina TaxID=2125989 RepID=UPI001889B8E9|nr:bifunctional [glutamate--ammonia ligase]-adenylyl-L-tyrosine phosphorylase/[glutamate--ammonia-ligase] adenylyltransferase [Neptunicella marina]
MHPTLAQSAHKYWQQLQDKYSEHHWLAEYQDEIKQVCALSDFVADSLLRDIHIVQDLLVNGLVQQSEIDYTAMLQKRLTGVESEPQLLQALRYFRRHYMVHIAWRDLLNLQDISHSIKQVSILADALIVGAYNWLYAKQTAIYGVPQGEFGAQPMFIMGMGKLGGGELNFSSDIDLIFMYPEVGEIDNGRKTIEHQQFFIRLAQKLINALNQSTVDGQVFRVDMRLRPYGESGALVSHFAALEDYYQDQGRDWERYAMVKGRVLNPDNAYYKELQQILKPFVYRRYIDFGAIESLRKMKGLISQEVRRRGLVGNIKLGQGGIREIEFIVQSLQLIRGGRIADLQQQSLLITLDVLLQQQILPGEDVAQLRDCYLYLRKVEQCLQQFDDAQTQQLPDSELNQQRLAFVMGCENYAAFEQVLQHKMQQVTQQFRLLIGQENETQQQQWQELDDLWLLTLEQDEAREVLSEFVEAQDFNQFWPHFADFRQDMQTRPIGKRGRESLDKLMPIALHIALHWQAPSHTELLLRLFDVLKSISRRTAYLELLVENPGALTQLIRLCDASGWIAQQIARFPLLLDELLNPQSLYQPTPLDGYDAELRQYLLRVSPDDLELQMEVLRQFKLSQQLKIAAADVTGVLPVMKVSDHLTYLAEAIIKQTVSLAWEQMVQKHGLPQGASMQQRNFAVLGYGKLGGIELGYGSDLDLVFVHNCPGNEPTDGQKSIESRQFYIRLAQRIMHLFATKTASGELYEVDLRLRPSGNAGMLVCHIDGFKQYQRQEAWTWEHQALVRSRIIVAEPELAKQLQHIRCDVLSQPRDKTQLAQQVMDMREKMRNHLSKGNSEQFDLKQDSGGIADIEFIVQFMVLAHSATYPQLLNWPDNVRILSELVNQGLMDKETGEILTEAYLTYRNLGHHLALRNAPVLDNSGEYESIRQQVIAIWQACFNVS